MSQFFDAFTQAGGTGALILSSVLTVPALPAGTTNNYLPLGLSSSSSIRIPTNAAGSTLTGLTAQLSGFTLFVFNIGPTGDLQLNNRDASSAAANRFLLPTDFIIPADFGCTLQYDATSGGWRLC